MSHRRRNRRFTEMIKSNEMLRRSVDAIARSEGRRLSKADDLVQFVGELRRRMVLVDEGTLPNGKRHISVRFDRLDKGISMEDFLSRSECEEEFQRSFLCK